MNKIPFNKFLPGIAWFFVVLVLIGMPGKDVPQSSLFELLQFDKFAHACIFGLMVILFIRPLAMSSMEKEAKLSWYLRIALLVTVWGLATEYIQKYFVAGRNFDLWDFVADATGCFIAWLFSKKYLIR